MTSKNDGFGKEAAKMAGGFASQLLGSDQIQKMFGEIVAEMKSQFPEKEKELDALVALVGKFDQAFIDLGEDCGQALVMSVGPRLLKVMMSPGPAMSML